MRSRSWGQPATRFASYASACPGEGSAPFLDADKSTRIRIDVSTDDFLEHRLAGVCLEARVLVRETLHFDLDRRWYLRNGVTSLLTWRSERVC